MSARIGRSRFPPAIKLYLIARASCGGQAASAFKSDGRKRSKASSTRRRASRRKSLRGTEIGSDLVMAEGRSNEAGRSADGQAQRSSWPEPYREETHWQRTVIHHDAIVDISQGNVY